VLENLCGIWGCEVATGCLGAKPEEGTEFRNKQETRRDKTYANSFGRCWRHAVTSNCPTGRDDVATNMKGVSINSAVLVPKVGTAHSVRMEPSRNPASNTRAK
jgi:hypothetical protein